MRSGLSLAPVMTMSLVVTPVRRMAAYYAPGPHDTVYEHYKYLSGQCYSGSVLDEESVGQCVSDALASEVEQGRFLESDTVTQVDVQLGAVDGMPDVHCYLSLTIAGVSSLTGPFSRRVFPGGLRPLPLATKHGYMDLSSVPGGSEAMRHALLLLKLPPDIVNGRLSDAIPGALLLPPVLAANTLLVLVVPALCLIATLSFLHATRAVDALWRRQVTLPSAPGHPLWSSTLILFVVAAHVILIQTSLVRIWDVDWGVSPMRWNLLWVGQLPDVVFLAAWLVFLALNVGFLLLAFMRVRRSLASATRAS